jgi:[ribosomal protein S5]-alanine N-acetyltransferase
MQTERTLLTLLEEADLPEMMEMAREPDTFRYIKKLRVMTEKEYERFLLLKLEQIRLKTGYHWAVRLKEGVPTPSGPGGPFISPSPGMAGTFIGAVNLNPIGNSQLLQIGCQLKRDWWGKGFASELTKKVLEFAIGEAGIGTVYGVFEKDNAVSRRLLQKLGFVWSESRIDQDIEIEIHRYPPVEGLP